jgi:hypothetical protein
MTTGFASDEGYIGLAVISSAIEILGIGHFHHVESTDDEPIYLCDVLTGPLIHNVMQWVDFAFAQVKGVRFFPGGYIKDDMSAGGIKYVPMSELEKLNSNRANSYRRFEQVDTINMGIGSCVIIAKLGLIWGLKRAGGKWDVRSTPNNIANGEPIIFPDESSLHALAFAKMISKKYSQKLN